MTRRLKGRLLAGVFVMLAVGVAGGVLSVASAVAGTLSAAAILGVLHELSARRAVEDALRRERDRIGKQQAALIDLTKNEVVQTSDLHAMLRPICKVSAWALDVERVSIWRYSSDGLTMDCVDLYEAGSGRHSSGASIRREAYRR